MCGINGILSLNEFAPLADELRQTVATMNDAIAHRGPDGQGIFSDRGVALGHRRLSIIDLSENAAQPMYGSDGLTVLIFNGEIYNYRELMAELCSYGHKFRSTSDTEVILHAYKQWGTSCVTHFNGMWAFALYDLRERRLFASRDRLGVKPFYYYLDHDRLVFSSEIKAILQVVETRQANLGKVYDYLAYGYKTNNGDTFFRDIHELPPATNLLLEHKTLRKQKYWTLPEHQSRKAESVDTLAEQLDEILVDAIKLRFRSDVPVAVLLSGGLDSTAITRVVDDLVEAGTLYYTKVKAFSAAFPGYVDDESNVVSRFTQTCRHIELCSVRPAAAALATEMPKIAYAIGEPVYSSTAFAHYELMSAVNAAGIKVVLNGQGADEALGGYDRYYLGHVLLDTLLSRPGRLSAQVRAMHGYLGYSYNYIFLQWAKSLLSRRFAAYLRGRFQEDVIPCLDSEFVNSNYGYLKNIHPWNLRPRHFDEYHREQLTHYGFNQILHYEDHSSMAHGVEIRSPFVDYRLMEFAFSLPMHARYERGITKRVLRHAFTNRLPSEIIHNRRKIGFSTPIKQWMTDPSMRQLINDTVTSSSFRERSIWKASKLQEAFANARKHTHFPFWRILNLEIWARSYGVGGL